MFASGKTNAVANGTANYIEDVFSTYLYNGTGATQTITNGIDLSTKGGLVWIKTRSNTGGVYTGDHVAHDTARGVNKTLRINSTAAQSTRNGVTAFNADGFTTGGLDWENRSGMTYASWTFRKQPKFFDVVTYTGDGTTSKTISHSLGSTPGFIITKRTDSTGNWTVWHTSFADTKTYAYLNTTAAAVTVSGADAMTVNSTSFTIGTNQIFGNGNGWNYVAYVFATNAGGFGLTGTDNVISCGTFTLDSINKISVTLGYEPQWLLFKNTSGVEDWWLFDNMRGFNYSQTNFLAPNTSAAESSFSDNPSPTATGFVINSASIGSGDYIYIAIRRGPMKVPTSGTSVFTPDVGRTDYVKPQFDSTFPVVDTFFNFLTNQGIVSARDRLRGSTQRLVTYTTGAETSSNNPLDLMYGAGDGASVYDRAWMFSRAPKFHDVVCWTGTGSARTLSHNLQAIPELILLKDRNNSTGWAWYYGVTNKWISMPGGSAPFTSSTIWNNTAPTSSVFSVGADSNSNASGTTYVAYLWASLAGISKIGTYVGNGSSQTINCGFTSGARFVMVTNLTDGGRWQVVDTARGINSASDPVIRLDQNVAEITGEDPVDPDSSGFIVNVGGPDYTFINNSGTTYLYLAIA